MEGSVGDPICVPNPGVFVICKGATAELGGLSKRSDQKP